jgi:multiple sugar transport system substrate-binding protein
MNRKSGRRLIAGVAAAAVSSVVLAGCSAAGGSSGPTDTKAPVTLTWWTGQAQTAETKLEQLAKEFHKDHPNVTINISAGAPTTDDLLQKITAGFASNQYPDISYAFGSWTGALQSSGRMQDITKLVKDPSVHWDQFPASGRETATPSGETIGFPSVIDNLTLLYNKKIFDAAHVAYPTNDWTWDQFRAAAKQLTDPSKQIYGTAYPVDGSEDTTWRFWPLLWQHGGQILSSDAKKSAFDSKAGVDSLTFLQQMAVNDKSVYLDQTDQKYEPLFTSGRIAMIPDGPWLMSNLKDAHTDYGVTFLPGTNGDHTTVSGPDIWALFDHKDANRSYWSYQLIKWLTDPKQDARYNLALGNLPMRPAAEQNMPEYKALVKDYPGTDVMIANFKNVKYARPTAAGYPGLSTAFGKAVADVLQGQGEPAPALKQAATAADSALAKG